MKLDLSKFNEGDEVLVTFKTVVKKDRELYLETEDECNNFYDGEEVHDVTLHKAAVMKLNPRDIVVHTRSGYKFIILSDSEYLDVENMIVQTLYDHSFNSRDYKVTGRLEDVLGG